MDPLSVVLTVITLATAVKDMVELAETIHASFEKVSDNLRNAQILSSEIKQMIYELKDFCAQHYPTLDDDRELKAALLELITKLKLFRSDTVPLIPCLSPSPRLLYRVKDSFKAWKNNDRIDASIRELKEDVKKCQMNFIMMGVARMQVKMNEMHKHTSMGLQYIQQGMLNLLVTHQNNVTFARTSSMTSTPRWKSPSAMRDQISEDTYLKGRIDSISRSPPCAGGHAGAQGTSACGFLGPSGSPEQATATSASSSSTTIRAAQMAQKLHVRRSMFAPGWAVPPRVLLVDDDAVSRRLSSKFLKVFGCMIDIAVDGIGAVNKMTLEKYDLVLMDVVMPKLDGVSATNLIRKFDQGTPIISMTSNSKPNEIVTYYSSGMNDILPKPFTKEGLLDMLEKHLMHLKVMQQMSKIGRPLTGTSPPLSDASFDQALTNAQNLFLSSSSSLRDSAGASSPLNFNFFVENGSVGDEDGAVGAAERINPLAGLGLTDEQ